MGVPQDAGSVQVLPDLFGVYATGNREVRFDQRRVAGI